MKLKKLQQSTIYKMKYIKKFESTAKCKYEIGDFVKHEMYLKSIFKIVDAFGDGLPGGAYFIKDIKTGGTLYWIEEKMLTKVEDYEIDAEKYNM